MGHIDALPIKVFNGVGTSAISKNEKAGRPVLCGRRMTLMVPYNLVSGVPIGGL